MKVLGGSSFTLQIEKIIFQPLLSEDELQVRYNFLSQKVDLVNMVDAFAPFLISEMGYLYTFVVDSCVHVLSKFWRTWRGQRDVFLVKAHAKWSRKTSWDLLRSFDVSAYGT